MPDIAIPRPVPSVGPFEPDFEVDDDGTEMYFRFPNGEVKPARIGLQTDGVGSEKRKLVAAGCTALDEYGTFKIQPYHTERPFEVLFQRGGAKELSVKEIIDQGFYFHPSLIPNCKATVGESWKSTNGEKGHLGGKRNNDRHTVRCWKDARAVEFPQLAGTTLAGPFLCKWCTDDMTGEEKRFATERGLKNHQGVVHPEEIGSDRLASQLIGGLKGGAPDATAQLDLRGEMLKMQEELERMRELIAASAGAAPGTFTCGDCGKTFSNQIGLNGHKGTHAKKAVAA